MLVILSPAKTQNFAKVSTAATSKPIFVEQAGILVNTLKQYSPQELESILGISPKLAELNFERYLEFNPKHYDENNSKPCILAYQGDVYQGLQADKLSPEELTFANDHLLILSGLYGALRPLDTIQAYRLEMATKLATPGYKDLYVFWHKTLQDYLNERMKTAKALINLASNEYSSALDFTKFPGQVVTVEFKDWNKDRFKVIGLLAKKARGMMARFIIKHRLSAPEDLKKFNDGDYQFQKELSTPTHYIFHRQ